MSEVKQYTEKQEAFLEALCGEARGSIREAMNIAGYSPQTRTKEVVEPLKDEIVDRAQTMLAMNAPRAAVSLTGVMIDPSQVGARNAVSAAKEVLDRVGLVKKEKIEVSTQQGGLFILPAKDESNESVAE
jgi:hypothetical protein